jgi:hypothetical protein
MSVCGRWETEAQRNNELVVAVELLTAEPRLKSGHPVCVSLSAGTQEMSQWSPPTSSATSPAGPDEEGSSETHQLSVMRTCHI